MIRVTTCDTEKTISFPADEGLAHSLVAACTSEPTNVEELLLAVEPFVPGTTARVMDDLLDFDAYREWRPGISSDAPDRSALPHTFEVVDGLTRAMARQPDDGGILRLDLVNRNIEGDLSSPHLLASTGTVSALGDRDRHTAYALDQNWNLLQIERVSQTAEVANVA
jgi:hypothetical protein